MEAFGNVEHWCEITRALPAPEVLGDGGLGAETRAKRGGELPSSSRGGLGDGCLILIIVSFLMSCFSLRYEINFKLSF